MATRRRLRGRVCLATFGMAGVAAFLSGCSDPPPPEPDSVVICAQTAPPNIRVEDERCDRREDGVGRYVMALPPVTYEYGTEYDPEDGTPYEVAYPIYSPVIIGDIGRPMPIARGFDPKTGLVPAWSRPGSPPGAYSGMTNATTVPARAAAGAALGASTISRGGLGVTGGGKSGYGAAGSSGGS